MSFTIRLKDNQRELNKDKFISTFPNSLISNALQVSSDTDIVITMPFVTFDVIDILWTICEKNVIMGVDHILYDDLRRSGDYLNIDLLIILGSPSWSGFIKSYPNINILNIRNLDSQQRLNILSYAIRHNYESLLRYALNQGIDPSIEHNASIVFACEVGHINIVKILLKDERVDPSDQGNGSLYEVLTRNRADIFSLLMKDSRVDPAYNNNWPIRYASDKGMIDIVNLLLIDERVNPNVYDHTSINATPLNKASTNGHLAVVDRLLQDKRVDPFDPDHALMLACENGHIDVVKRLLLIPDVDPNRAIFYAHSRGHTKIVLLLLQDTRLEDNTRSNIIRLDKDIRKPLLHEI